jgi:hypothetical protein
MKGHPMRVTPLASLGLAALVVILGVAAFPAAALAQGCAMCKTALDGPVDPLTEAFNVSSLFLMATPYTVVGTVGAWIYIASRRRDPQPEHDDAAHDDAAPEL